MRTSTPAPVQKSRVTCVVKLSLFRYAGTTSTQLHPTLDRRSKSYFQLSSCLRLPCHNRAKYRTRTTVVEVRAMTPGYSSASVVGREVAIADSSQDILIHANGVPKECKAMTLAAHGQSRSCLMTVFLSCFVCL
jgi:hypothetical protein